ncbi:M23 family metallopeptidase [Amphibacillus cookii]|uniref:M23 family metallopeptidase n=1 Tax=Amphibacillus cookii TaxID=767787 RepID=UPI00195EF474|nr:M23 family metallopeptidase [Amphibacillus cookii]MBM7540322.1 biotin carboxyl carrier protein [Amphibacillus cookii]
MYDYESSDTSNNNVLGVTGSLPFTGRWLVGSTPAKQIPSHGTDMFGVGYAIDFMAVDEQNRTSPEVSWRTFIGTESPEIFYAFGKPVVSPVSGKIVSIHNGEPDHEARRSLLTLIPYAAKQNERIRKGPAAIAGNYIIISPNHSDVYIAIVHLQLDSLLVKEGDHVSEGEHIANCGNSGNSTQPHIHIQAMTSLNFSNTKGVPLYFNAFNQWGKGNSEPTIVKKAFPRANAVVSPRLNE